MSRWQMSKSKKLFLPHFYIFMSSFSFFFFLVILKSERQMILFPRQSFRYMFAQLPARFLIIILKTRFSSLAVNLPQRTRLLPRQVTQDMLQTAALNRDLLSKWDVDDTPWKKKKKKERDGGKRRDTLKLFFFVFCCIWLNAKLINRYYNLETLYTIAIFLTITNGSAFLYLWCIGHAVVKFFEVSKKFRILYHDLFRWKLYYIMKTYINKNY